MATRGMQAVAQKTERRKQVALRRKRSDAAKKDAPAEKPAVAIMIGVPKPASKAEGKAEEKPTAKRAGKGDLAQEIADLRVRLAMLEAKLDDEDDDDAMDDEDAA